MSQHRPKFIVIPVTTADDRPLQTYQFLIFWWNPVSSTYICGILLKSCRQGRKVLRGVTNDTLLPANFWRRLRAHNMHFGTLTIMFWNMTNKRVKQHYLPSAESAHVRRKSCFVCGVTVSFHVIRCYPWTKSSISWTNFMNNTVYIFCAVFLYPKCGYWGIIKTKMPLFCPVWNVFNLG